MSSNSTKKSTMSTMWILANFFVANASFFWLFSTENNGMTEKSAS